MGYTTEFEGVLKFTKPLDIEQLKLLKSMEGIDPNDHPEFKKSNKLSYIQFEVTDDFSGLKWDGNEKFYYAENALNFIIENMREKFPDFGLDGELRAQGEDFGDRWILTIENGKGVRKEVVLKGKVITCPHCEEKFELEESE